MAQGLDISYHTIKLTPDDGLSQGSNYFRYEDSKGFMWMTGNDAVNRYDGSSVKVYNLDKYFKNCPNLQQGYGFAEDDSSNIYIGSVRGLYKYSRVTDKFTLVKIYNSDTDTTAMPFGYNNGKIWCFNKNYQLASLDAKTGQVRLVTKINLPPLHSIHIYDIQDNVFYNHWPFIDNENNCWFIGKDEVCCYSPQTNESSYPLKNYFKEKKLQIYCSAFDRQTSTLYLCTIDGIVTYSFQSKTLKEITILNGKKLGWIYAMAVGPDLLAMKSLSGIILSDKSFQKTCWLNKYIPTNYNTYQYGFDKSKRLWFCLDGLGQVIFDFKPTLLNKEPNEDYVPIGTKSMSVGYFSEFGNKDILIQCNILKSQNNFTPFINSFKFNSAYSTKTASGFQNNGVWFCVSNMDKSTDFYFIDESKQSRFFCKFSKETELNAVQDIFAYSKDKLLCSFSNGLFWFDSRKKTMQKVPNQPVGNCFKINELANNKIAISYLNSDMWLAAIDKNASIHFEQKILPGTKAFYAVGDEQKKIFWVATDNGIFLLNEKYELLNKFDANSGMAGTYIYGLLLDDAGNVWCSHQRGISSISAGTHKIINYTKEDGLQEWDFNNRSFYKATDGTLYFGGINGFNYFKPPVQPSYFYQPEVYIDEIKVNEKTFLPDNNANLLNDINLGSFENNLSFHVIVKDLEKAKSQRICYRLNNGNWVYLSNNTFINFANLAPGTFTLNIGISNRFLEAPIVQKNISIKIALPFYRTVWFAVLLSFAFSALLFFIYIKRKQSKQRIIAQQQTALDQQRQAFTADLHDDIGASLSSLQLNSAIAAQVFDKNPQQSKEMLQKVEGQSQQLAEKIGDFIWSMKPRQDEFMTLSSRIKTYTGEILGATPINHQLKIDSNIDHTIVDFSLRKNLLLIVKEALNNAAKYSKANNVLIEMKIEDNLIVLEISDDGIGLPEQNKPGNGLKNMRTRTKEMKGVFTIETGLQKGVTILVSIPCP